MALPNLSALQQQPTGRLQNAHAWLGVRRFKGEEPSTDPITLKDWRAWVRDADDGPVPKYGWVLEVDTGDGKRTPEIQYLYDVQELAQHLLNGGASPTSRLPAHRDDRDECIARANALRRARGLSDLEPQGGEQSPPPLPIVVRRDRRQDNAAADDPELEAAANAAARAVQELVQRQAEDRAIVQGHIDNAVETWEYIRDTDPSRATVRDKAERVLRAYVIGVVQVEHLRSRPGAPLDPAALIDEAEARVPPLEGFQYHEFEQYDQQRWAVGSMRTWAERVYELEHGPHAPPTFAPTAQQRDGMLGQL